MSLVEKAMAKKRRDGGDATEARIEPVLPVATQTPPLPASPPRTYRTFDIDQNALRAAGYLPEASRAQQCASEYRKIKRSLVQRALQSETEEGAAALRLLTVVSALPGDGKTFTSINLAFSMAREKDISVLLVDADIHKPRLSEVFGLLDEPGLLDALVDESLDPESVVLQTNIPGLSLLPVGARHEEAPERLTSIWMNKLVTGFVRQDARRVVIFDAPPLLVTSEAAALVKLAGQIVLVACAGKTPRHALLDAIELIDEGKEVGIVLNKGVAGFSAQYYGYGEYGSYGKNGDDKKDKK